MTSVDLGRVRALVEQAFDLPRGERARYLRAACGSDRRLLEEVEEILDASERDARLLESPWSTGAALAGELEALAAGTQLAGFRLVQRVAVGGMGAVWEAEQEEPRRKVAIKMLRSALVCDETRRRFRHEASILARLQHPNIAQIFASGVLGRATDATPWYAMEFVEGARTLVEHAREEQLDLRERVRLFLDLCAAVQHGHERGVIHRDLKPGNVLVGADGVLKVIDFGVARVSSLDGAPPSVVTEAGRVIGTLQYMSPEQITGASNGLDVRSDVYSLGVLLYELATGGVPHDVSRASLAEAARALVNVPPPRPRMRARELDLDLEAVVMKALEGSRERRYPSAGALADDLRRWLDHEPVSAQPPSVAYQLRSFARRHRVLVGAAGAIAIALIAGTAISLSFAWSARRAERDALAQRDLTRFQEYSANLAAAYGALRSQDVVSARQRLARCPETLRGFEWRLLQRRLGSAVWTRAIDGRELRAVRWHQSGERIYTATSDGSLEEWDVRGARPRLVSSWTARWLVDLALALDGSFLAALESDGQVHVLELNPLRERASWRAHERRGRGLALSPDGSRLASSSVEGEVALWKVSSAELVRRLDARDPARLAFSPDGALLAAGCLGNDEIVLWSCASGERLLQLRGHAGSVADIAFSPDGRRLASAAHDGVVRLWRLPVGELEAKLYGHTNIVWDLAFDRSGARLISTGWDRTIRAWDVEQAAPVATWLGPQSNVVSLDLSPDGLRAVTGDEACELSCVDLSLPLPLVSAVEGKWYWTLEFLDRAQFLALHGGRAELWSVRGGAAERSLPNPRAVEWISGDTSTAGGAIVLGDMGGHVECVDLATGAARWSTRVAAGPVRSLVWSEDPPRIAAGSDGGELAVLDPSGTVLARHALGHAHIEAIACAPASSRVAAGDDAGHVWLFEDLAAAPAELEPSLSAGICDLAWDPRGECIALALNDGRVVSIDLAHDRLRRELSGHEGRVGALCFSPDGLRLATGGDDRTLRLWDVAGWREVAVFSDHTHAVQDLAFSPDGELLISGSSDSTLRWWDASAREPAQPASAGECAAEAWALAQRPGGAAADLQRAAEIARSALELEGPHCSLAWRALGLARLRAGETAQALDAFARARALAPADDLASVLETLAKARSGQRDAAARELEQLRAIEPGVGPHGRQFRAWFTETEAALQP